MLLCAYLVYKGKNFPETQNDPLQSVDKPLPYLFYRGIELHPRIFDIDVKQVLLICILKLMHGVLNSTKCGICLGPEIQMGVAEKRLKPGP